MNVRIAGPILFVLAAAGGGIVAWQHAKPDSVPTDSAERSASLRAAASAGETSDSKASAQVGASTKAASGNTDEVIDLGALDEDDGQPDSGANDAKTGSDSATASASDTLGPDAAAAAVAPAAAVTPEATGIVPPSPIRFAPGPLTSTSVAASATNPAVKAHYEAGAAPIFVTAAGTLTPVGKVAQRWLHEARFHHLVSVSKAYAVNLMAKLPLPPAAVEAELATQLASMAANLPPQPRTMDVVEDKKTGAYLSPDVLWQGKAPMPMNPDIVTALMAAANQPATLEAHMRSLEPKTPQYRRLVEAAQRYEANICSKGEWPPVFVPKKSIGKGWSNTAEVTKLQQRLAREGFYSGQADGIYGEALENALSRFQERTNLKPVGRFNRPTAKTLNIPCTRRVRILALNANRWRHTALTAVHKTFVHVNLPGFHLRYFRDGKFRAERRVIVGKGHSWYSPAKKRRIYRNATPILSDVIQSIIFNPTWTLPTRVILNDVGPKIEADPDWLKKNGYIRQKRGDGRDAIIQLPSKKNALGDVKFYFPNSESIYLHDTNRRGLFMRTRRDFSHGCVRVHEAVAFATEVLKDDLLAKGEEYKGGLKTLAAKNNTVRFPLHAPVSVFLEYYTATVDAEGNITFHPDIYDYDYAALIKPIGKMLPVWPPGT